MIKRFPLFVFALFVLAGCEPESKPAMPAETRAVRSEQALAAGERLYAANCARCHGLRAEGAQNWQRPDVKGKYPAPPLDGSGHAWHHPLAAIKGVIKGGTLSSGGNMPAWGDKLSDQEIEAVIAWFQSLWPGEIRQAWTEMNTRAGHEAH